MEIRLPHTQLQQALELLSRVSTKHITLPVLQCVRISTTNQTILLQATNLEINLEIPIIGEVIESGEVAVPTQVFLQSIQYITDTTITLRLEEGSLQVETKTGTTAIKVYAVEEFPTVHHINRTPIQIVGTTFAHGIRTVAFAASQASIKPELGSVYIQQKREHTLTFVATDSFRLMEKTVSQKQLVLEQSLMIPAKNALELARVIEVMGTDPVLMVDENVCALQFENGVYISSRLVTGSFPDYVQIIPKEFCTEVTVLKDDVVRMFKKTSVFLNKFRQVTVALTAGTLTASATNSEVGQVTDTIPAAISGDELTLSFNQQYLIDPLQYVTDDSIVLKFAGVGRALVIQGVTDTSLRYLVMPMNK
jgi:DNA polymerase-3 subunit beta